MSTRIIVLDVMDVNPDNYIGRHGLSESPGRSVLPPPQQEETIVFTQHFILLSDDRYLRSCSFSADYKAV